MRGKELIKNTGILMVAKISTQFVSFLLLPLYTSLLTTSEYGEIDIYTSLVMIIIPFLTLQLEMGLFRFFITENSEEKKKQIVTSTFFIISVILVICSLIYWLVATLLSLRYIPYVYLYYLSTTIATVLLQVCRAYGDNMSYGIASFISSALAVCLNVFFIAGLRWKVEGILLSSTLAQTACSIYIIVRTRVFKYFDIRYFNKETGKSLLNYSVPLVFNQVSSWAINYSDRLIILVVWGTATNGIYSLANKFSNIVNTFFNVFNVAWTENVVRTMNDEDNTKYVNKMFMLIFNIYMVLITGIINLLPFFFSILVDGSYNDAYRHVPVLLFAIFFSGMAATIGSVYIAYGKTKEVSITTILAGICNIVVHFSLLKFCGLYAASISTLVSFGLLFVYRYVFVRRFFPLEIKVKDMVPQVAIYIVSWVAYIIENPILIIASLLLNLCFAGRIVLKNREMLIGMIRQK